MALLETGINARDKNGKTALILAAWRGDLPAVQKLLSKGADVLIVDNLGDNALHYAARQNNTEVLSAILKTPVDKNLKSKSGYKQTPLFTPAEVGNIPVLSMLLQNGCQPNVYDKGKFTPLQWAAQQGKTNAIQLLLKHGANPNTSSSKGITPLISASISGVLQSVALLLKAGAKIDATAKNGYTALIYAAYYGHADIVQYLLNNGADKGIKTLKNETALFIAEKKKFDAVVAVLC